MWSPVNFPSWQHFIHVTAPCWRIECVLCDTTEKGLRKLVPGFPDSAPRVFSFLWSCSVSFSHNKLQLCVPLSAEPCASSWWSTKRKGASKEPAISRKRGNTRFGCLPKEGTGVGSDSISRVKPFLDFNFSVFSLSWSRGKQRWYGEQRRREERPNERRGNKQEGPRKYLFHFTDYKNVSLTWAGVGRKRIKGFGRNGEGKSTELN